MPQKSLCGDNPVALSDHKVILRPILAVISNDCQIVALSIAHLLLLIVVQVAPVENRASRRHTALPHINLPILSSTHHVGLDLHALPHWTAQVGRNQIVEPNATHCLERSIFGESEMVRHVADHRVGPQEFLAHSSHQQNLRAL